MESREIDKTNLAVSPHLRYIENPPFRDQWVGVGYGLVFRVAFVFGWSASAVASFPFWCAIGVGQAEFVPRMSDSQKNRQNR